MYGALILFEDEFIHIVAISFSALILTELIMVALTIRTWHYLMVLAEVASLLIYLVSLVVLHEYFGKTNLNNGEESRSNNLTLFFYYRLGVHIFRRIYVEGRLDHVNFVSATVCTEVLEAQDITTIVFKTVVDERIGRAVII